MADALKQFVDTANARADANAFKAGAKAMAEHFDAERAKLHGVIKSLLSEVVEYTDHDGSEGDACAACAAVNRARSVIAKSK